MKGFSAAVGLVLAALSVSGCFGVEPHGYKELSPITINTASDTINVNLGTELVYNGLDIVSAEEVSFQWAYGEPASGSNMADHKFASMSVISESRTIDYTFPKVGSFLLRLKVDNGESIAFKFFTLNVNSGYDEGVAILSNDGNGDASLTFVKTLTADEAAKGERQVFTNIFSVDGKTLRNGTSLFIADNTYRDVTYSGFLIATDDEDGTIYHMDCKTFEYYMSVKMSDFGTSCAEFGGEYAEDKASFGCFFRAKDNRVFRYDMNGGFINEMTDISLRPDRIMSAVNRTGVSAKTYRTPFFFDRNTVGTRKSSSAGPRYCSEEGWDVVNVAVARSNDSYPVKVLLRSQAYPDSCRIMAGPTNWSFWKKVGGFESSSVSMDSESKFVTTTAASDAYYIYGNAIYRWNMTSAPGSRPAITLPSGEIIRDIAVNYKGRPAASGGEDLLYVVTCNPSRTGEHKGSLYVYRFADDSKVASYEGICDDPVSVIYKYRIN